MESSIRSVQHSVKRSTAVRVDAARNIAGIGRIYVWNGGSLWIGRGAGRGQLHAHQAIQITLAQDGPVLLRSGADDGWREYHGAVVRHNQRHQFDGCGARVAQIFVEPETAAGRALIERYGQAAITPLTGTQVDEIAHPLFTRFRATKAETQMIAAAQAALDQIAARVSTVAAIDPRITRVLGALRTQLAGTPTLAASAALAYLSPSRFRHLFVEQTGISFRAYVLWLRLNVAAESFNLGQTWTVAAHRAGFADSAHLSRTFRRMFGITPVMLIKE